MTNIELSDWLLEGIDASEYVTNTASDDLLSTITITTLSDCPGGTCLEGCEVSCTDTCETTCQGCLGPGVCEECQSATCEVCESYCETCQGCEGCEDCESTCESVCQCSYEGGECTTCTSCECSAEGIVCQTCEGFCEKSKQELYKHIDSGEAFEYAHPILTQEKLLTLAEDWTDLVEFVQKGIQVYKDYGISHTTDVPDTCKAISTELTQKSSINTVNQAINEFINCATEITDKATGGLMLREDMITFATNVNKAKISTDIPCCESGSEYESCITQQN